MRRIHLVALLVLLALALPASPAQAGGVVSVCDETHLLSALSGGGTVTFTCSGTITLTKTITVAADTTIDGSGQTVTISGNKAVRVFMVNNGVTLSLNRLTVANGYVDLYDATPRGAGVLNSGGTLIIDNSTISGNYTLWGAGVYSSSGSVTVSNSNFVGNYTYSTLDSHGGGSGIYIAGGALDVADSTFSGNDNDGIGGGIYLGAGTATVSNSTFSGNSAGEGGGIYSLGGTLTVSNSTFSGNFAWFSGGGISIGNTYLTVSNSTFSGNTATLGGASVNSGGTAILRNTIAANASGGKECRGLITDGGGNLSYPDATCPGINADPLLGPLQNNNGPTKTMALGPGSPAIDAANDAVCAAPPVNNLDQRGVTRPQGAHCDIGAVEMLPQLGISPSSLPGGAMGAAYSQALTVIPNGLNVEPPAKFSVQSGTLPTGLALSSGGLLSGKLVAPGAYSFQLYVEDSATWKNQGVANYTITVTGTNHPPTFTSGGNVTVPNNAAAYNAVWAANVSAGGPDDAGQTLAFHTSNDNNALFSVQPAIAADGKLSFTIKPNANGAANVSVYLSDNGGVANGGSDTSSTVTFQIVVVTVQTGPTYTVNTTASTTDHLCGVENCTLREAIEAANNDGVDSTIELATGAVYTVSEVDNSVEGPNGLPQIGTPITINGHGASITRDAAVPYARFFYVATAGLDPAILTLNDIQLENGKVDRNAQDCVGGAILNSGTLIVKNSYLAHNEAGQGAVVYNHYNASFYDSTFYANSSDWGAIVGYGSLNLYSNTFFDNTGVNYTAMHLNYTSSSKDNIYNNLFLSSGSTVPLCGLGVPGTQIKIAGSLATDSSCQGSTTTYAAIKPVAPDYNGGLTKNMAIQAGSSAIDIGNATGCQDTHINNRDQRGYARFVDGNGDKVAQCDIGAFEYGASGPPTATLDPDPSEVSIELTPAEPDGANGWYHSPVTVKPQASDPSPVIELRCALDPAGPPAAFDDLPEEVCPFLGGAEVSAAGMHTFYAAAMDIWGNKSAPVSASFKIAAVTSLEVTVNREQAYAGAILEYKLMVRNLTADAQAFAVSDPIPQNTEIVRRINYNPATNAVEWSGVLEAWGFGTFTVYVRIVSGTAGGTAIVNTATLEDGGVGGSASATTTVKMLPPYRGHREDVDVNEMVIRGN
jgi:CSLREA domain-containing protein